MTKNPFARLQKYYNELLPYSEGLEPDPHINLAHIASDCLDYSDRTAELLDNTPLALYGRYDFRDGAAIAIAAMYGLDIDMARQIMRTHSAWAEYKEALKSQETEGDEQCTRF